MKVVSSYSDSQLACRRAKDDVAEAIRNLTANLLRVTRGAGKAHEIRRQAIVLIAAMQAHWDACGMWPSSEDLESTLSLSEEPSGVAGREALWQYAEEAMVKGALQMAASTLLEQRTQRAAGHTQLFKGLIEIERMREENHREFFGQPKAAKVRQDREALAKLQARSRAKPKA